MVSYTKPDNVMLSDFYDDMNKHPTADYDATGRYVVEIERFRRGERAFLRVWEAVGNVHQPEGNTYQWVLRGRESLPISDADETFESITGSKERISVWASDNRPNDYDTMWKAREESAEWSGE